MGYLFRHTLGQGPLVALLAMVLAVLVSASSGTASLPRNGPVEHDEKTTMMALLPVIDAVDFDAEMLYLLSAGEVVMLIGTETDLTTLYRPDGSRVATLDDNEWLRVMMITDALLGAEPDPMTYNDIEPMLPVTI